MHCVYYACTIIHNIIQHNSIVKSFVELARYLLSIDGVRYLLSERFNQDALEEFFGMQRGHGGRCDNPTIMQFIKNTVSLRIQKSAVLPPAQGNCGRKRTKDIMVDDTPLLKRRRKSMPK